MEFKVDWSDVVVDAQSQEVKEQYFKCFQCMTNSTCRSIQEYYEWKMQQSL